MTAPELIAALADTGSVLEFGKGHTQAVTALGDGGTHGRVCLHRQGRYLRQSHEEDRALCPLCGLLQHPGGVPGGFHGLKLFDTVERQMAVLNAASTLVYAYSEATTVKVTLVIGNAIGSAYVAMGGSANADMTYAWPGSVISPMTGEAAIQIMWKDKIMASKGDAS